MTVKLSVQASGWMVSFSVPGDMCKKTILGMTCSKCWIIDSFRISSWQYSVDGWIGGSTSSERDLEYRTLNFGIQVEEQMRADKA